MRKFAVLGVLLVLALAFSMHLGPQGSDASSHREAPLIAQDPSADNTDVYVFRSPDRPDTVTIIGAWWPLEEAMGGPTFYQFGEDVRYEFYVDNNGDALEDIAYYFRFDTQILNGDTFLYNTGPIDALTDPDYNLRQAYTVTRLNYSNGAGTRRSATAALLGTGLLMPPNNIGPRSTPNYEALFNMGIYTLPGDIRVFAGQADDPFFVDLGVFDLLALRNPGIDTLKGYNVQVIALQVPINQLTRTGTTPTDMNDPAAVIGVWSASSRTPLGIFDGGDSDGVEAEHAEAESAEQGILKICKVTGSDIAVGTLFNFTVGTRTITVPAGFCVVAGSFALGAELTIRETIPADQRVTAITVEPAGRSVGTASLTTGTATVGIGAGVTEVTFTNERTTDGRRFRQVSRLGMPLVNEVVIPLRAKDRFNASRPINDEQFLPFVLNSELATLLNALYGVGAPTTNRQDLVTVFLTGIPGLNQPPNVEPSEMIRLNVATPPTPIGAGSRLGVLGGDLGGFPNGRRLIDDVVDIALQVVAGELVGNPNNLGDNVDANDRPFRATFPYVALPHEGFRHLHHACTSGAEPCPER